MADILLRQYLTFVMLFPKPPGRSRRANCRRTGAGSHSQDRTFKNGVVMLMIVSVSNLTEA
jgi:hypothetical protein